MGSRSAAGICVAELGRVANSFCAHLLPLRKPQFIDSFPRFKNKAHISYLTKLEQRMFFFKWLLNLYWLQFERWPDAH